VEEVLPSLLPSDVIVLNPPRTGIDGRVTEQLEQCSPPPRGIVYVSCNPATLARDLSRMPRFGIAALRAYDMFPQTAHVETVCELVPLSA
jgi:tRNA/tmRNA/rRNA uracil-C5-methylase (TrmA/RlmC/RlmD family)